MKKKVFSILAVAIIACVSVTMLAACGGDKSKTATAYGVAHKSYQGVATVTVKGDKVTDIKYDELLFPYSWATFSARNTVANGGDDISTIEYPTLAEFKTANSITEDIPFTLIETSVASKPAEGTTAATKGYKQVQGYATYIKVGDDFYELVLGSDGKYSDYKKVTDATYKLQDKATTDQVEAKKYYDACMAGNYKFAKAGTTAGTYVAATHAPNITGTINKGAAGSTYGGTWQSGKGWENNVNAMIGWLKKNGFNNSASDFTKDDTTKNWGIGTGDSRNEVVDGTVSATLTDFKEYYTVMKAAYELAKAK